MMRLLAVLFLLLFVTGAEAAPNCWVPTFRTLDNQTVTGYMSVKTGKRCSIMLRSSRGPTYSAHIVARPANGNVWVGGGNRVFYQSRSGFVGKDSFSYARDGFDTRNNPVTRTVRVDVEVTP